VVLYRGGESDLVHVIFSSSNLASRPTLRPDSLIVDEYFCHVFNFRSAVFYIPVAGTIDRIVKPKVV
jgi:hypothetical protein